MVWIAILGIIGTIFVGCLGVNLYKTQVTIKDTQEILEQAKEENEKIRMQAEEMIEAGASIYIDGIEVDADKINLNAYHLEIRDDIIILWD